MEENADDLHNWTWLQDLVQHLGEHGMSSEESEVENDVEQVCELRLWNGDVLSSKSLISLTFSS